MVVKDKPCDTPKSEFVMVSVMLYGDLSDTWAEHVNTVTSELRNKKRIDETGAEIEIKEKRGMSNQSFVVCLSRLKDTFLGKFTARKQKACTRNGLTKPRVLGVK